MYTAERLFDGKCNMMLSCDKSLCNVLNYWTTFMMHKNAQANFTRACLNVTRHWWDSKSNPPPCKSSRLSTDRFWLSWYFNISLNVPLFHHNWCASMVSTWMA
jgi:hypothetical protein